MPRASLSTGPALAQQPSTNLMTTFDGQVRLASTNLAPNPDFTSFTNALDVEQWVLGHPPNPTGWYPYARLTTDQAITRQADNPVPLHHSYQLPGPLGVGPTAPDPTHASPVVSPMAPMVQAVGTGAVGFPAGPYLVTYAYHVSDQLTETDLDFWRTPLVTAGAPPVGITLSNGQALQVTLPTSVPKGVGAIGIYMSPPGGTVSQMRLQVLILVRRGIPKPVGLVGPYKATSPLLPASNQTYIGAYQQWAPPAPWWAPSPYDLQPMWVRFSYSFLTQVGWSASQQISPWVNVAQAYAKMAVYWRPGAFPVGAIAWRPEYQVYADNNPWYTLEQGSSSSSGNGLPLSLGAGVLFPPDYNAGGGANSYPMQSKQIDRAYTDQSGVPNPDVPIAPNGLAAVGAGSPVPGPYEARATYAVAGGESPPSPPTFPPALTAGQTLKIYSPLFNNKIPNGHLTEMDVADGLEADWEKPALPAGVTAAFSVGQIFVWDKGDSATDYEIKRTRVTPITPSQRYAVRYTVALDQYVSGAIRVVFRQLDANGNPLGDQTLATLSGAGTYTSEWKLGPAGSGSQIALNPNAVNSQLVFILVGSSAAGRRNLRATIYRVGRFPGHAAPRMRPLPRSPKKGAVSGSHAPATYDSASTLPTAVSAAEDPATTIYSPSSYCVAVKSPPDGATRGANVVNGAGVATFDGTNPYGGYAQSPLPLPAGYTAEIVPSAAIDGVNGWRIKSTDTSSANTGVSLYQLFDSNASGAYQNTAQGGRIKIRIVSLPSRGAAYATATILKVTDSATGVLLGNVALDSNGRVALNGSNGVTATLPFTLNANDVLDCEIAAIGAHTTLGTLKVRGTVNNGPYFANSIQGLDWRNYFSGGLFAGAFDTTYGGTRGSVAFEFHIDSLMGLAPGEGGAVPSTAPVPGNAIEYFGANGSPLSKANFISGMKIPVLGGTTYCASIFLDTVGVGKPASPLASVFRDASGKALAYNPPIISGLSGSNEWRRYYQTMTAPQGASYVEFVPSGVGDGKIRAMGFQFEPGSAPSAFTNQVLYTSGVMTATLDTYSARFGSNNPVGSMNKVLSWLRSDATVTNTPNTSYSLRWRSGPDLTGRTWTPWYTSFAQVPINRYVQIELTLTTTTLSDTPVARSIWLDFVRPTPLLLRDDHSEFDGGCTVVDMPPVNAELNVLERVYADYSTGFRVLGSQPRPQIDGFNLECFAESAANEIMASIGQGKSTFVIEDADLGMRYVVRPQPKSVHFKTDRSVKVPNPAGGYAWLHRATGVKADVLDQTPL